MPTINVHSATTTFNEIQEQGLANHIATSSLFSANEIVTGGWYYSYDIKLNFDSNCTC